MKAAVLQPPISRKEEEEVYESCKEDATGFQSNLELRLGMPVGIIGGGDQLIVLMDRNNSTTTTGSGGGPQKRRCFAAETAPAGSGFVDPWSLAARQEKAALEQAVKQPHPSSSMASRSINPTPPPSSMPAVVGWPPVRSFRRNLGAPPQQQTKSFVEKAKNEVAAEQEEENVKLQAENTMDDDGVNNNKNISNTSGSSMFVKVNMEGYAVGRKIDLKAHHCYDSLSRALQKMFHNLLSAANYSNKSKQEEGDEIVHSPNYVLLYEDNEGDKMLVGDVPWEMFISSVKRLYISLDQRGSHKCGMMS